MKQFFGMSQRGEALEKRYPGVPSIGCIGMSYQTAIVEQGVGIIAFSGVAAAAGELEEVSTMPVKYIQRLERDMQEVNASGGDTVCIDFCTGNDACVLTTMYTSLQRRGISLVGGTGGEGRVSANGPRDPHPDFPEPLWKAQRGRHLHHLHQGGSGQRAGLFPPSQRFRRADPLGAGGLPSHHPEHHSPDLPRVSPPLGDLLRELSLPLQALLRAGLHADLSPGDGGLRLPRRRRGLWRAL